MIGRQTTKAIAEAYQERFVKLRRSNYDYISVYERDEMYDFLYVNDFDGWICNIFHGISSGRRSLFEFILKLHTGESIASATSQWDWPQRQSLGQRILRDLSEALIKERINNPKFETYGDSDKKAVDSMRSALELDGYVYKDGTLFVPEEGILEEKEEQGLLEAMMIELSLQDIAILRHHLELSSSDYQAEKWDDSISNSRKVLEGVLQQAAVRVLTARGKLPTDTQSLERPQKVRELLESEGLLDKKERETLGHVYGLLSQTGSHPYIAERDQARLMRHLSLTFCQFVMLRLRGALENKVK